MKRPTTLCLYATLIEGITDLSQDVLPRPRSLTLPKAVTGNTAQGNLAALRALMSCRMPFELCPLRDAPFDVG